MIRQRSAASTNLPLAFRIPNPPNPHLGRAHAMDALSAAFASGPVVVVCGPEGTGKTALACAAWARLRASDAGTMIDLDTEVTGSVVERLLMRIATRDALPPDWRVLSAEAELARMTLLDLCDSGGWTVVLDDLGERHAAEVVELLRTVANYATRSRWIVTTRRPELLSGLRLPRIALEPLTHDDALALIGICAPGSTVAEHLRIVERHGTTPGRLVKAAHGTRSGSLDPSGRLHDILAALERPLPAEAIAPVIGADASEVLRQADQLSGVSRLPAGLWLRRDARSGCEPDAALVHQIIAALLHHASDIAAVEALRLLLRQGRVTEACTLLDHRGEPFCERGLASDLWHVLHEAIERDPGLPPELATWRTWAAFEWGDLRVQAELDRFRVVLPETARSYLAAHLAARLAMALGDFDASLRHALAAAALTTSPTDRTRALCRAARAEFSAGRISEALQRVEALETTEDVARIDAAIIRMECLAVLDRRAEAVALTEQVLDSLPATTHNAPRLRALLGVTRTNLILHRLRDAERTIDALIALRGDQMGDAMSARSALEISAAVAVMRGNFARVDEVASRLLAFERAYPVRALFVRSYQVVVTRWQRASSTFRDEVTSLRRLADEQRSVIARDISVYCDTLQTISDELEGIPPRIDTAAGSIHSSRLMPERDWMICMHKARWGHRPPAAAPDEPDDEVVLLARLALATWHALQGDHAAAVDGVVLSIEAAVDSGRRLRELDGRRLQLQVLLGAGLWEALRDAAFATRQLGLETAAPRLVEEAEFYDHAAPATAPLPEHLERWASSVDGGPRRRWSQWLLGHEPALDLLERKILERCTQEFGWTRCATLPRTGNLAMRDDGQVPDWTPGCGLDRTRRCVWLPAGSLVLFDQHEILWSILDALALRGGTATKEELVCAVWRVDEYHPLNHDNRLRVAVRKLRDRLGELGGPSARDLVGTTTDGYELLGPWRRLG